MNLKPKLIALAFAAAAMAPAATAGQPSRAGNWGLGAHKRAQAGQVSVHVGSQGFGVDLSSRRARHAPRRSSSHVHGPRCQYIPGHYETIVEKVWHPGRTERVWQPAEIEVTYTSYGQRIEHVIRAAQWDYIEHPGQWDNVERQVWVPAQRKCHSSSGAQPVHGNRGGGITPFPQRRYPRRR